MLDKGIVKSVLYYTSADHVDAPPHLGQGVVTGLVSGLMATGRSFQSAIRIVALNLPKNYVPESIPKAWRDDIDKILNPWKEVKE